MHPFHLSRTPVNKEGVDEYLTQLRAYCAKGEAMDLMIGLPHPLEELIEQFPLEIERAAKVPAMRRFMVRTASHCVLLGWMYCLSLYHWRAANPLG